MFEMGLRKAENRSISRAITNSGNWKIVKAENKEAWLGTAKLWVQEEKGTLPGTNHMLLSDVCVCACVLSVWILVLSGSLRVYTGKGSRAKELSDGGEADQNLLTALISTTHIF